MKTVGDERRVTILPRFNLVPFGALQPTGERTYLVKGLVPRVGLTIVWGPPKSGKSFWAFDVAMHVALGWEYRGRRVSQGPVVYAALEGADGYRARAEAFRQRKLAEDVSEIPLYLLAAAVDLVADHADIVGAVRIALGGSIPAAVVLDTLNRSLRGSESSDEDMGAYVKAADSIREAFNCAVIVVHHCGHDDKRPRGHTSLTGAADAQIAIKKDEGGHFTAIVEWMKDGPEGAVISSRLETVEIGTDADGDPMTSCVVVPSEGEDTSQRRGPRLSGATRIALDLLKKVLAEAGEPGPIGSHVPRDVTVVSSELWRKYCYAGTVTDSEKADAKRQAFARAAKTLQETKTIGVWNDLVWIARPDA